MKNSFIKYITLICFALLFLSFSGGRGHKRINPPDDVMADIERRGDFRLMFYNVENLFDIYDDTLKRDDEFLPDGEKHWTPNKYWEKLNNICKVITAVGGWDPPDVIGLCELENRFVLEQLIHKTPLSNLDYKIIHHESPDRRGIDVGLLYRTSKFEILSDTSITIVFPWDHDYKTRDILYVLGKTKQDDTLHIFISHWPSKYSGQLESEPGRFHVASVLRFHVDSLLKLDNNANIIVTGDFNDGPEDKSVLEYLRTKNTFDEINTKELYNLSYYLKNVKGKGSYNYQGQWEIIDQLVVSGRLLTNENSLHTSVDDAHIFDPEFLSEKDENNVGLRPFRTYSGMSFHGGFSDHYPVYLDLWRK